MAYSNILCIFFVWFLVVLLAHAAILKATVGSLKLLKKYFYHIDLSLLFFCTSRNPKSNSWLTSKLLIYILLFDFSFFAQAAIGSKAIIGLPKNFFLCTSVIFVIDWLWTPNENYPDKKTLFKIMYTCNLSWLAWPNSTVLLLTSTYMFSAFVLIFELNFWKNILYLTWCWKLKLSVFNCFYLPLKLQFRFTLYGTKWEPAAAEILVILQ